MIVQELEDAIECQEREWKRVGAMIEGVGYDGLGLTGQSFQFASQFLDFQRPIKDKNQLHVDSPEPVKDLEENSICSRVVRSGHQIILHEQPVHKPVAIDDDNSALLTPAEGSLTEEAVLMKKSRQTPHSHPTGLPTQLFLSRAQASRC